MVFHNDLYSLGCPVWACANWKGTVYPRTSARQQWLPAYSKCFNTVEGNSTFYGIPHLDTFRRWANEAAEGFEFCLKFPRTVSHDQELVNCDDQLMMFLRGVEQLALGNRLGPTFLQLGPRFNADRFPALKQFVQNLPAEFPYAVEVRNPQWFEPDVERQLFGLLERHQIDRVVFDSRPLYAFPPTDEYEVASQQRKPRVPIRTRVTGRRPMLRLVGRNDVSTLDDAIEEWAELIAIWIENGLRPIVFAHTPDDSFAPEFAMRFHNHLATLVPQLSPMDRWPHLGPEQKSLF